MAKSSTSFKEGNLFYLLRKSVGRPLKVRSAEELALRAIQYFEWANENDKGKYTFAGIKLFIGFSRENWREYKMKPDFVDVIDHIELLLEDFYEKKLHWAGSTQGAIFVLKNKAGWKDESTVNENVTRVTAKFATAKKREVNK